VSGRANFVQRDNFTFNTSPGSGISAHPDRILRTFCVKARLGR